MNHERRHVALLCGGHRSEHRISLLSARSMARGLVEAGFSVHPVVFACDGSVHRLAAWSDPSEPAFPELVETAPSNALESGSAPRVLEGLSKEGVVAAVLALHGPLGEDGRVQALLDLLGLPYTGSNVLACATAGDKLVTKRLLRSAGIATPPWIDLKRSDLERVDPESFSVTVRQELGFPVVVKPRALGSSVGVTPVLAREQLFGALRAAMADDGGALIEAMIHGREMTVAVVESSKGPRALPVIEIVPKKAGWFDYASKYDDGGADEIVPASIPEDLARRLAETAVEVHRLLGCAGVTRTDFMVDGTDTAWVLEINTTPGMTDASLVPKAARASSLSLSALMALLVEGALAR